MAEINKEALSRLSLTERVRRLKEIEKAGKKELKEVEKLIKETETQIKTSEIALEISPAPERIDISSLFKPEEGLESEVSKETRELPKEEDITTTYIVSQSAEAPAYTLEHETMGRPTFVKIEEQSKYTSTSKDIADKSVASRSVAESSKKYSKG